MQKLADADAEALKQTLKEATNSNYKKVIIATHVPPFPECSWHKDKPSDNNWLPYFASKAIGDVIVDVLALGVVLYKGLCKEQGMVKILFYQ